MEPRSFRRQSSNSRIRSSPTVRGTRRLAAGWDLRGELQRSMPTAGDDVRRAPRPASCAANIIACSGHGSLKLTAKDRKSTRLNSSHDQISYAVFCLKKKKYGL